MDLLLEFSQWKPSRAAIKSNKYNAERDLYENITILITNYKYFIFNLVKLTKENQKSKINQEHKNKLNNNLRIIKEYSHNSIISMNPNKIIRLFPTQIHLNAVITSEVAKEIITGLM